LIASSLGAAEPAPIDLPTALQLAGAQNFDIQIAREKLAEAKANHESARLQFFPWLSPGAGYRKHEGRIQAVDGAVFDASKQSYNVGGTLTAQVDIGDALYKTLATHQLAKAADHALEAQRQDTVLAAAEGYFELTRAQAAVGVAREAVRISQEYQDQLHQAVGIGIAFKGDELRARVQADRNQLALRRSQEQQRVAAARLAQVLRLDPKVELAARDAELAPLTLVKGDATLDALVGQAFGSRPELRQSGALTQAARETKDGAVFGPMIPTVGAQAFAGGLGGGTGSSGGGFGDSEDYFFGVSWRIGPGGLGDFGRIRAADARLKQSQLVGEKLRDEITRQVVESQTHAQSLADQLATVRRALGSAEETYKLARARKEFGVGVVVETILAEQELTRTRNDYLATVAEFNKAQYALVRAIGSPTTAPGK
jgi:outer membrane protein TolC